MLEALWNDAVSPYEVLDIPRTASVAEVRAAFRAGALRTHPDKQSAALPHPFSFLQVRAAGQLLMDPELRSRYDHLQFQSAVRTVGLVSGSFDLTEFEVSAEVGAGGGGSDGRPTVLLLFSLECRCGGVYEVLCECYADTLSPVESTVRRQSACDCCSLVIEVTCNE